MPVHKGEGKAPRLNFPRDLRRQPGIVFDQRDVGLQAGAAVSSRIFDSRNGVTALPVMPSLLRRPPARRRCARPSSRRQSRPSPRPDWRPAGRPPGRAPAASCRSGRCRPLRRRLSGALKREVPRPEGRHHVRAVGDDRHAARLQHLQRLFDVEDGLGAGRDDDHRRARQFVEIGRDVEALLRALVDAADAAGGEHLDAGKARPRSWSRRPSCRRSAARRPRSRDRRATASWRPITCASALRSASRQPDLQPAVDDGDGRRHRAFVRG